VFGGIRRTRSAGRATLNSVVRRWLSVVVLAGVVSAMIVAASGAGPKAARGAVRLVTPSGKPMPGAWQSYANAALVPTVRGRVTIRRASCPALPGAAGCVYTRRPRVIWLRPGVDDPRGVLLHELGHVFDLTVMNNRDRGRFRRIMGRGARRKWWQGSIPLAEQFAEAYSWCARYARIVSISRYSSYDYRPSARQHHRICALIKAVGRDREKAQLPVGLPVVTAPHPPPPLPPSTAAGTVPGDPSHDPGPQHPEDPNKKPTPTPTPTPTRSPVPTVPVPVPTARPTATPTIPPLPGGGL
jgi:hypothetical protein